jgi:hypothetical protein
VFPGFPGRGGQDCTCSGQCVPDPLLLPAFSFSSLKQFEFQFLVIKTIDPDPDSLEMLQCCGSGSGIRDWVLFDPWIRDPE